MNSTKDWLTVPEAAERASVSQDTIYEACLNGELERTKIGGRRLIRIKREWVDVWMERHKSGVEPPPTKASIAKMIVDLTKETRRE